HIAAVAAIGQARREELVLPSSAYAEVLVDPWRRGPGAVAVVRRFVTDLGIRIEPLTEQVAERAARLRAHHRALRLPDALAVAPAAAPGMRPDSPSPLAPNGPSASTLSMSRTTMSGMSSALRTA